MKQTIKWQGKGWYLCTITLSPLSGHSERISDSEPTWEHISTQHNLSQPNTTHTLAYHDTPPQHSDLTYV